MHTQKEIERGLGRQQGQKSIFNKGMENRILIPNVYVKVIHCCMRFSVATL